MTGASSLDAVKRKIKFLQEQADGAEEKSERLQRELLAEKSVRAKVSICQWPHITSTIVRHRRRAASPVSLCLRLRVLVLLGGGGASRCDKPTKLSR